MYKIHPIIYGVSGPVTVSVAVEHNDRGTHQAGS